MRPQLSAVGVLRLAAVVASLVAEVVEETLAVVVVSLGIIPC